MKHFAILTQYLKFQREKKAKEDCKPEKNAPRRVLPNERLGGGVPHGSQNPDPISDQNILFSRPFFRPIEAAFNRAI